MDEQEQLAFAIRRAKLFIVLPTALLMILLAGLLIFAFHKTAPLPPDDTLAPSQAAYYLHQAPLLCKLDGTYYQLTGTVEFESLFQTGQWSDGDAFSLSDAPVAIRFADQYLLFLNGAQAAVYNGYAAEGHASTAYYALPAGVPGAVPASLLARGPRGRSNAHLWEPALCFFAAAAHHRPTGTGRRALDHADHGRISGDDRQHPAGPYRHLYLFL